MARKLRTLENEAVARDTRAQPIEAETVEAATGEADGFDADDQDIDLPFFEWAGREPGFFEWAGSQPRVTGELERDADAVRRAVQTLALVDAMESFYGPDLFWAHMFGTELPASARPRVVPADAYARLPKNTITPRA